MSLVGGMSVVGGTSLVGGAGWESLGWTPCFARRCARSSARTCLQTCGICQIIATTNMISPTARTAVTPVDTREFSPPPVRAEPTSRSN